MLLRNVDWLQQTTRRCTAEGRIVPSIQIVEGQVVGGLVNGDLEGSNRGLCEVIFRSLSRTGHKMKTLEVDAVAVEIRTKCFRSGKSSIPKCSVSQGCPARPQGLGSKWTCLLRVSHHSVGHCSFRSEAVLQH
jgi:hypothetical protein